MPVGRHILFHIFFPWSLSQTRKQIFGLTDREIENSRNHARLIISIARKPQAHPLPLAHIPELL